MERDGDGLVSDTAPLGNSPEPGEGVSKISSTLWEMEDVFRG